MSNITSTQKLVENEAVFRKINEKLLQNAEETNRLALEDNQPEYLIDVSPSARPLHFACECADENCTKKIQMTLHDYAKIHRKRDCFTVVTGHFVPAVEKIVESNDQFDVVQKFEMPPESVGTLNETDVHNA